MNYLQIVVAFLWDILIFKTKLKITDIIGSILIIGVVFSFSLAKAFGLLEVLAEVNKDVDKLEQKEDEVVEKKK